MMYSHLDFNRMLSGSLKNPYSLNTVRERL
jgi:hypothetical protein